MRRFILMLLIPFITFAQTSPNTINVKAVSSTYVTANVIKIKIRINAEDKNSRLAFENHKLKENKLLGLLEKYKIPDSLVSYSLLNFRKTYDRNKENIFQTNQEVVVSLISIKDYTDFQIDLLENDFNEFNATYSSNNLEGAKEKGYQKAIKNAKEDASAIAKAMNKKLGDIVEVNTTTADVPYMNSNLPYTYIQGGTVGSDKEMTEIEQSIQIKTNLEVKFKVIDK